MFVLLWKISNTYLHTYPSLVTIIIYWYMSSLFIQKCNVFIVLLENIPLQKILVYKTHVLSDDNN